MRTYRKGDFFIRQHEKKRFAGWVEDGTFQYTHIDEEGEEHIVGYSFTNEYVCDYSSFMKILGDKYGNPTVWKMRSRKSV